MTDKDFSDNGPDFEDAGAVDQPAVDGRPEDEGSDATASGPAPQENPDSAEAAAAEGSDDDLLAGAEELTVDDILNAPSFGAEPGSGAPDAALADAESALLNDLKRVHAEYANYRRRTEDQREVEIARAKGSVAKGLLPVLDDLDRAEKHGDLVEGSPLAAIAEKLRAVVARLGVETYGAAGDAFDPQQHEAIFQAPTPGTEVPTILEVVEVGYRLGTIELRPAKVVVAVPAE